jgi:hypothetical protein
MYHVDTNEDMMTVTWLYDNFISRENGAMLPNMQRYNVTTILLRFGENVCHYLLYGEVKVSLI